ncbi:hypothetical protein E2C01_031464 [Portunus trituberculatus]|uniref:Uncharacterized protein n=1 Tax=Portunus trituberculatus TaxID=210409 RepID=A0A5B7EY72_PORTR|nr:hypothetical protein [Portunus trituberculatus]
MGQVQPPPHPEVSHTPRGSQRTTTTPGKWLLWGGVGSRLWSERRELRRAPPQHSRLPQSLRNLMSWWCPQLVAPPVLPHRLTTPNMHRSCATEENLVPHRHPFPLPHHPLIPHSLINCDLCSHSC